MALRTLEVQGLRGFATAQRLDCAVPNGTPGSGLTIVVGSNNGGKSTVIEAFRAASQGAPPSFTVGKRNALAGDRVSIRLASDDGIEKALRTLDAGGSECEWLNPTNPPEPKQIFVLPSRRHFNPFFGKSAQPRQQYIAAFGLPPLRGSGMDQFSSRLFQVQQKRDDFNAVLARVLNPVPDWTIDQADNGQYYLRVSSGPAHHNSDGLGEGIVSLLFIVDALYDSSPNDIIVIDEPELSMHPALQRRLMLLLRDYASERQIIYATHSPYFVDIPALAVGARVARVYVKNDASQIAMLSISSSHELAKLAGDSNNPHVVGLDAREVLFLQDRVILVEGQEDVIYYSKILDQIKLTVAGQFFGWGVGGASKMPVIARVLSELGFEYVAGILDNDQQEQKAALSAAFPQFRFHVIPAKDVRSKPAIPTRGEIDGLVDAHGELQAKYHDEVEGLFKNLNAYFG